MSNLNVEDETGYWDTNDFEKLRKDFTDIAVGLDEIAEKLEEKKGLICIQDGAENL